MKIKCPHCQAALIFDVASQSMECEYCGSIFGMQDIQIESNEDKEKEEDTKEQSYHFTEPVFEALRPKTEEAESEGDEMICKLLTCSSCGANLMVNETESATFCAYCGQPTLVVDRISNQKKPKYILPFGISREEAERIVRNRVASGFFVPNSIKHFKTEKLHGVYIPYRMVDVYCQDELVIKMAHRSNNSTTYSYHYRKVLNLFKRITVDASNQLNDQSSVRLEPYDLEQLVPFEPAYLSGFYANCMDTPVATLESNATLRAVKMLDDKAAQTIKSGSDPLIVVSNPYTEIEDSTYIMLPAWFLSFKENERNYTIMVNGQTGKCVGAVPPVKAKVIGCITVFSVVLAPILSSVMSFLISGEKGGKAAAYGIMFIGVLFVMANAQFQKVKKSCELTTAQDMRSFANDRQEV